MLWKERPLPARRFKGKLWVERVDARGKSDVFPGESAGAVGGEQDVDPVPDIAPFRVVIGLFGKRRDAGHEGEGFAEVAKPEASGNAAAAFVPAPARQFRKSGFAVLW